jgi:hypothetical protein
MKPRNKLYNMIRTRKGDVCKAEKDVQGKEAEGVFVNWTVIL